MQFIRKFSLCAFNKVGRLDPNMEKWLTKACDIEQSGRGMRPRLGGADTTEGCSINQPLTVGKSIFKSISTSKGQGPG